MKKLIVVLIALLVLPSITLAAKGGNKPPGGGDLEQEIADREAADIVLQNQIDTIELTPGPQGEPGLNGTNGTNGLPGTNGTDGLPGTNGTDGLSCWDTNGDMFADDAEDINNDGAWNTLDCQNSNNINPSYPDGFGNIIPLSLRDLNTSPYTVPAGKSLYISNLFSQIYKYLAIDGKIVAKGYYNTNWTNSPSNVQRLSQPLIAGSGSVISSNSDYTHSNGFLVDSDVEPITEFVNLSSPYVVPSGKVLFILNIYLDDDVGPGWLLIDGLPIAQGPYNSSITNTSGTDVPVINAQRLSQPIIVGAGSVFSTDTDEWKFVINGYLR